MQSISVSDARPGRSVNFSLTVADVAELRRALVAAGVEKVIIRRTGFISVPPYGCTGDSLPLPIDRLPEDVMTQLTECRWTVV